MTSNIDIKKILGLIKNINQTANLELKLQSLAKIKANLMNESHLTAFKQLCGFKNLCQLLKNNSNTKVINLVLSILANCAMKPNVCKEIVTEHHVLADVSSILFNIEHPSIHCRAIRLVANVAKTSAYFKYVMKFPFLTRIVSVLKNSSSSDTIITCIRAIKHLWLWDQYRVHTELINLNAIKLCLDKLTMMTDKPALILTHLSIIQSMLNVNCKALINQMSYLHYEWMVNLMCKENGKYDSNLIPILLKLSTFSKIHFELAKTNLVDQIISLLWPMNKVSPFKIQQLLKITSALCKENLFRQKIIQSPTTIVTLLSYLDADLIEDSSEHLEEEKEEVKKEEEDETKNLCLSEDTMFDMDSAKASTYSAKAATKSSYILTNAIHYNILLCIQHYQYDHEGLYRFLKHNMIPILMRRLCIQIDKYEYKHVPPVCDQSKYLSTRQSLNTSENTTPLSPGNMSPQSSSLSPLYLSPNRSPPSWHPSLATPSEITSELGDPDEDDDDKSVYSPQVEFSDENSLSNAEDSDSNDVRQSSTSASSTQDVEERLDVHIIRIMLHIAYMRYPFEQLSYKNTWNTLLDYLVKVQQDDCCRNVYKILLIICKKREFLRALLLDNFILLVHKKLCRMKHGTYCMICSNVMIYGQGILNEISNETNSHFGFSEIMHHYYRLVQLDNQSQPNLSDLNIVCRTEQNLTENEISLKATASDQNELQSPEIETQANRSKASGSNTRTFQEDVSPSFNDESSSNDINTDAASSCDLNIRTEKTCKLEEDKADKIVSSDLNQEPTLIHFMIPYLLKDHPLFQRVLFGSDAVLARILSDLEGRYQEEAVSCVQELLSLSSTGEATESSSLCRENCAPPPSYEGDITFLLDDGSCQKANRDLLITRSLYFETMLCGNFKECDQKNNIKLGNISSACLSHLLKLIAHYDTCSLPRNQVKTYLELIIKSDEYLLHELNYKLIQLLYAPNVIVNSSNIHLVYAWSLRYNEFVQSCLSNYENFFYKSDFSPSPLRSGKRKRLNESAPDEKKKLAGTREVQSENLETKTTELGKDKDDSVSKDNENISGIHQSSSKSYNITEKEEDTKTYEITVIASEANDKAMGELCLIPRDENCDKIENSASNSEKDGNVEINISSNETTTVSEDSVTDQPGCSYKYDEKINKTKMVNDHIEDNVKMTNTETNKGIEEHNLAWNVKRENIEIVSDSIGVDNVEMTETNTKEELSIESEPTSENKSSYSTNEPMDQPCLISDLINEIDQNNIALLRKPSTSALPKVPRMQTGLNFDGDKIQTILLLKNEPSFKLRRLQTPLAGKRKLSGLSGHNLSTAGSGRREDLNIHLIKRMFNTDNRKSVDIVRNLIAISGEHNIFEHFKQDLFNLVRHNI